MENTALEGCALTPEHGLSLYIEYRGKKLLLDPLQQGVQALHLHKAVPGVLPDVPADADEAIGVRVFGEVGPRRSGAEVHFGPVVDLEEPAQAVGVVVVTVGQGGQFPGKKVFAAVGGFHMFSRGKSGMNCTPEYVFQVADALKKLGVEEIYTGQTVCHSGPYSCLLL